MTTITSVDDVLALYERHGEDTYGEDVTQNEHALQCAAIAEADGASEALIVAALLHDIGHLVHLDETGEVADAEVFDDVHEAIGARVLAKLGDSVTTDHISPAGSIKADSPAGQYLQSHGVDRKIGRAHV